MNTEQVQEKEKKLNRSKKKKKTEQVQEKEKKLDRSKKKKKLDRSKGRLLWRLSAAISGIKKVEM